jgi:hypothetical protein
VSAWGTVRLTYVDDVCVLVGFYAAQNGSLLPTFRENLSGPIFKGLLDVRRWTDRLSRNVCETGRRKPAIPYQAIQLEITSLV